MNESLARIKELLSASSLGQNEQDELFVVFSMFGKARIGSIEQIFSQDPSLILKISENYKAKQEAIKSNNVDLFKKIVQDEQSILEGINE